MTSDTIDPEKLEAYDEALYWLTRDRKGPFMTTNRVSPHLVDLYRMHGADCAIVITAFNPFGKKRDEAENLAANAQLKARLEPLAIAIIEGQGGDAAGIWGYEDNFLALGIDRETSIALGREFLQDAVLHAGPDAIPRLLVTR